MFIDVLFPQSLSFGRRGGPSRNTRIARSAAGHEQRQPLFVDSLRSYDSELGIELVDLDQVTKYFEALNGRTDTFPFFDHADYQSCDPGQDIAATDQAIGTGDNSETDFQLVKNYTVGAATHARPIVLPVEASVLIAFDGSPLTDGFTVSRPGGVVTFDSPPGGGVAITAGYDYHVLVRFDADDISLSLDHYRLGSVDSIRLQEVRLEDIGT